MGNIGINDQAQIVSADPVGRTQAASHCLVLIQTISWASQQGNCAEFSEMINCEKLKE